MTGALDRTENFVEGWGGVTHHGSKNIVPVPNPNTMHIDTKTGRLLGTQPMMMSEGMNI